MKIKNAYLISSISFMAVTLMTSCGGNNSKKDSFSNNVQHSSDNSNNSNREKAELELTKLYESINKNSINLIDSSDFSIETTVSCDESEESTSQVFSKAVSKTLKLLPNKVCNITIDKFRIDKDEYKPTANLKANKLTFTVNTKGKVSASDNAGNYTAQANNKVRYINAATTEANELAIGLTDTEERFNKDNFNFDVFTLTYNGEQSPAVLNASEKYKNKNEDAHKTSFGFVLPDSSDETLRTITWGGKTEASKFTINVIGKNSKVQQITLKGYSMTDKCPTYSWVLNASVSHQGCGQSHGFKIEYDPNDNLELKPGVYEGSFVLQAINWHQIEVFQNIFINLNITKPDPSKTNQALNNKDSKH